MLAALARALRLTGDERDHLYFLAGRQPPRTHHRAVHVSPALLYVLDALEGAPATVVSDLNEVLVQNALARALLGDGPRYTGMERSITYRWFADPAKRDRSPAEDHAQVGRTYVADLRATWARRRGDADVEALVARLSEVSEEFRDLWDRHEVAVRRADTKRVVHPLVGTVELDCEVLFTTEGDQGLVLLTARPGTEAREQLEMLRVVGLQDMSVAGA